jgi:hypothetical protein
MSCRHTHGKGIQHCWRNDVRFRAEAAFVSRVCREEVPRGVSGTTGVSSVAATLWLRFPRLRQADPLQEGRLDFFVPCGAVAGVIARTDAQRGVWKAPA